MRHFLYVIVCKTGYIRYNFVADGERQLAAKRGLGGDVHMGKKQVLTLLAVLELAFAVVCVALDLLLPSLVIALVGVIMLLIRREPLARLGYRRQTGMLKMAGVCFLWAALWTVVDFGLLLPLLSRLAGTARDLRGYQALKGNVPMLLGMLTGGWLLGGLLEEFAFRGVLMERIRSLLPVGRLGIIAGALFANVLFGFIHVEQGLVGVLITIIDAMFFTALKTHYRNTWAATLAHGFLNTIGIMTLFFTGPLPAFW